MKCSQCKKTPDKLRTGVLVFPGISGEKRTVQICPFCGCPVFVQEREK